MAKRHIKKPKKNNANNRISNKAVELKSEDWDSCYGRIAFINVCNKKCLLSQWHEKELKDLIKCFIKVESKTWSEIKVDSGLKYEIVKQIAIPPPDNIPPDVRFGSLRVNDKNRLYGYRLTDTFYIVWFDKNHVVCPQGKSKPYAI